MLEKSARAWYNAPMMKTMTGLPPLLSERATILILGSFPSVRSLEKGEYYGHERNHFWELLGLVFGEETPDDWAGKQDFLCRRGIAVWDVIASCERKGSLDADIRKAEPNPLLDLIAANPGIGRVALNGSKAAAAFVALVAPELAAKSLAIGEVREWEPESLPGRRILAGRLPSTSPIPTRGFRSAADKLPAWSAFLLGSLK